MKVLMRTYLYQLINNTLFLVIYYRDIRHMIMIFRRYGSLEDIRYNINCIYIPAQKIFRSFHNFADEIVDLYSIKYCKKKNS